MRITTDPTDAPLFRLSIEPSESNGLRDVYRLMVDKITTVAKTKLGTHIGRLAGEDMVRLNPRRPRFLGIAAPPISLWSQDNYCCRAVLLAISREFGKSVDWLLTGEEKK